MISTEIHMFVPAAPAANPLSMVDQPGASHKTGLARGKFPERFVSPANIPPTA
jgi:hypothetical protein